METTPFEKTLDKLIYTYLPITFCFLPYKNLYPLMKKINLISKYKKITEHWSPKVVLK